MAEVTSGQDHRKHDASALTHSKKHNDKALHACRHLAHSLSTAHSRQTQQPKRCVVTCAHNSRADVSALQPTAWQHRGLHVLLYIIRWHCAALFLSTSGVYFQQRSNTEVSVQARAPSSRQQQCTSNHLQAITITGGGETDAACKPQFTSVVQLNTVWLWRHAQLTAADLNKGCALTSDVC